MSTSTARSDDVVRILEADGTPIADTDVGLSPGELVETLRLLIRARRLDRECVALQRDGELTVYPSFEGQEAAQVGSALALGPDDFVFPSFREMAVGVARGVDLVGYIQYHRGTWHGGAYDALASRFAPVCVPVATQIVHAVGWALGAKLDNTNACAIAYFGDGSASEGDFHEGANLAAVLGAPAVLFCQNNGWAISVPTEEQYAAPIVDRAAGYGIPGVRVDGNDLLAVYSVTRAALERARRGDGPTLIEALTYRMGHHTTSDDATRYRDEAEVEAWRAKDPIERLRRWMLSSGHVDRAAVDEIERETEDWVREIRAGVTALGTPPREDLFAFAFADPPPDVRAELERG
jgi:2-oxoisovalerate dehydrogenase E1 component alpha subunit